jgi:hypothetical protein
VVGVARRDGPSLNVGSVQKARLRASPAKEIALTGINGHSVSMGFQFLHLLAITIAAEVPYFSVADSAVDLVVRPVAHRRRIQRLGTETAPVKQKRTIE